MKETLEVCRLVYNSALANRISSYKTTGKGLTRFQQEKVLPDWKKEHPRLATVQAHLLQNVIVRVDLAFQAFFRRVKKGEDPGFPRFKGESQYDSFTFKQWGNGCVVKINLHRPLPGIQKTCVIRRYGDKWFACVSCEIEPEALPLSNEVVGIDVGIEKFAVQKPVLRRESGRTIQIVNFLRGEDREAMGVRRHSEILREDEMAAFGLVSAQQREFGKRTFPERFPEG